MAFEPFSKGKGKKTKSEWTKPANIIALVSVIALLIVFIGETSVTINANSRLDKAYDESRKLQEQLNSLLNSTLAQSNNLTQSILELQNITSNYEPKVIPYYITANVGDVYTNMTKDVFGCISDSGSLNMSLVVITPHASVLNFTDTSFNVQTSNGDWINASNFVTLSIYLTPWLPFGNPGLNFNLSGIQITGLQYYNYWPEAFVQPGVTQVNFTIAIHATIPLNSNFSGIAIGTSLGMVETQINLLDIQTNRIATMYYCSTAIMLNVNA